MTIPLLLLGMVFAFLSGVLASSYNNSKKKRLVYWDGALFIAGFCLIGMAVNQGPL